MSNIRFISIPVFFPSTRERQGARESEREGESGREREKERERGKRMQNEYGGMQLYELWVNRAPESGS